MARHDSNYLSLHRCRHHSKHEHHGEESNHNEYNNKDEKDKRTPKEAVHTDATDEENMPTDSMWSTPYLDPESGGFSYQVRKTPNGQWEYAISGSRSGIHLQDPIPAAQAYAVISTIAMDTPSITENILIESYAQYPYASPYLQLVSRVESQEHLNGAGDTVAPEINDEKSDEREEVPAAENKAPAGDRSAAVRNGALSHRRHEKRRDGESSSHRRGKNRHKDGHGHRTKATSRKHKDVDSKGKVLQWLGRPTDDESGR